MRYKRLTKLNIKAMIISITACAFGLSLLLPTMTWFADETASKINVDGNIHGSYFESGDGTAANPFEIARPIQLYYLSWLQEMGYFNEAVQNTTTGEWELKQQYHFYLSRDIDMNVQGEDPYLLPPIGTIEYPFIGSFDGKGHVITDLVITNDVSEYTNDPKDNSGGSASYEILGLFGVLGTTESTNVVSASYIDSSGYIHKLTDTSTGDDITVAFQNSGNYVTNIYLDNVTIVASVDANNALAGAVAGYSNATVSNIGIHGATLTFANGRTAVSGIGTSNLSDYAAFGFVTPDHKRQVNKIEEQVYQPKATANTYVANSAGNEWGGSVNFQSMNKRLWCSRYMPVTNNNNNKPAGNVTMPYPIKQTYINGTLQGQNTSTVAANRQNGQDNGATTYYYSDKNAVGLSGEKNTIGSYYYAQMSNGGRLYLGGRSDIGASSVKHVTRITETDATEECYYIKDGNNYIGVTNAGAIQKSTKNNTYTSVFHYNSSEQCLYTRRIVNGVDTIYFLNVEGGEYIIEPTSNTTWTRNVNSGTFTGTPKWKFKIHNGSYYLRCNNASSVTNGNSNSTRTTWNISNHGTSNLKSAIYITYQNNTYYLNYDGHSNSNSATNTIRLYYGQYNWWTRSSQSGTDDVTFKNDTKYLYNSGDSTTWQVSTTSVSLDLVKDTSTVSGNYETATENSYSFTITQEASGQAGYVPLTAVGDNNAKNYKYSGTSIGNLYAAEINTGYLVGGFYDGSNGGKPCLAVDYFGDARVALYDRDFVNQSWTTSGYKDIWTIDDSCYNGTGDGATEGTVKSFSYNSATAESFVKLKQSLGNMERILNNPVMNMTNANGTTGSTAQVAGVHFMDSTISMDRVIKADAVMINGEYKTDYEMPEDSIDFTLKENGYINFLAGNYQSDNNSFFALHQIERYTQEEEDEALALDPYSPIKKDDIKWIKKIKFVFKDADDPLGDSIFLYDDEGSGYSWSDGESISNRPISKSSFVANGKNYDFAFDTKWIGVNASLIPCKGSNVDSGSNTDTRYKRLYYFEIPVNVGEYALGSCDGGCGGYLVYLDISAASQVIERKTVNEMFHIDTLSGDIPYGTQYVPSIPIPQPVLIPNTNEEDKTAIVRDDIENIDDLDSYYGSINTSANGNYTFNRSGDTITVTGSSALTSNYISDGLTLSGSTSSGRTSRIIRRITDYDYNTIIGTYVKQTTTIEIEGSGNTAHNYARTKIEYNDTDFDDPLTTIAIFSYDWVGDGPNFIYSYYLRLSADQNVNSDIEVFFNNYYNDNFVLTVEYVANNFNLICIGDSSPVTSSDIPAVVDENNPYPTRNIIQTSTEYENPDKWYDFTYENGGYTNTTEHPNNEATVTPTVIATFNYTCEGSQVIEENFMYSGYDNLGSLANYTETPTSILINNGSYIYEFILSGSGATQENPIVAIYYVASGTYVIRYANGSEYILFVDESQQQNP